MTHLHISIPEITRGTLARTHELKRTGDPRISAMIQVEAMAKAPEMEGEKGYSGFVSDGDDRRIFLGLKFSISRIFLGRKIWLALFGWNDLRREFLGIQNNLISLTFRS